MGLEDAEGHTQTMFLGPDGGNMKLAHGTDTVQVISSQAPLARALLGKFEGDEVGLQVGTVRQAFEVVWVA